MLPAGGMAQPAKHILIGSHLLNLPPLLCSIPAEWAGSGGGLPHPGGRHRAVLHAAAGPLQAVRLETCMVHAAHMGRNGLESAPGATCDTGFPLNTIVGEKPEIPRICRALEEHGVVSYGEVTRHTLGRSGQRLVDTLLIISQTGAISSEPDRTRSLPACRSLECGRIVLQLQVSKPCCRTYN